MVTSLGSCFLWEGERAGGVFEFEVLAYARVVRAPERA